MTEKGVLESQKMVGPPPLRRRSSWGTLYRSSARAANAAMRSTRARPRSLSRSRASKALAASPSMAFSAFEVASSRRLIMVGAGY